MPGEQGESATPEGVIKKQEVSVADSPARTLTETQREKARRVLLRNEPISDVLREVGEE